MTNQAPRKASGVYFKCSAEMIKSEKLAQKVRQKRGKRKKKKTLNSNLIEPYKRSDRAKRKLG